MVFFSQSGRPMPPTGDRPTRHLAALALMAGLTAACGGGGGSTGGGDKPKPASDPSVVSPDSLAVNIEGLPKEGPPADVTITGPSGYRQQLSSTQTLTHLAPGVYTITAATVTDPNHPGLGRANKGTLGPEKLQRYPERPVQTVKVEGNAAASITVTYPEPTLTIAIPSTSGADPTVAMPFVLVPAGSFVMGDNTGECTATAKPAHTVTFDRAFYVARAHCTQAQWQAVMGNNPSANRASPLHPVTDVTWYDIRSAKTGFLDKLKAAVPGFDFHLPSEAEYEYVQRAGTKTRFFFGDNESDMESHMWTRRNAGATQAVEQRRPNAWGLYDIAGNAWCWCEDDWHESYAGAPDDGSPWANASSHSKPEFGIIRGGSYYDELKFVRSAYRAVCRFNQSYDHYTSFRVVMPVPVSVDKGSTGTSTGN
jgi:formylglycine-generating enzyme required for sulfatase activity